MIYRTLISGPSGTWSVDPEENLPSPAQILARVMFMPFSSLSNQIRHSTPGTSKCAVGRARRMNELLLRWNFASNRCYFFVKTDRKTHHYPTLG